MAKTTTLVLIHGFLSGPQYWNETIIAMNQSFNIISICLKGFSNRGKETAPDSIKKFSQDVICQLDELGIDNFHLLGHSMGGMIAQQIAHDHPNRLSSLILYGTGPKGYLPGRFEELSTSIKTASKENYFDSINRAVKSWFKYEKNSQCQIKKCLQLSKNVSFDSYLNGLKAMQNWSGENYLYSFTIPTLIIWGDSDKSYPWDEQPLVLWQSIKNSSLSVIPNCAHNAHLEKPTLFNHIIEDFLTNIN